MTRYKIFKLYTDTSLKGPRGFFFYNLTKFWIKVEISQSEAFLAWILNYATSHPLGPTVVPKESTLPCFWSPGNFVCFQLFAPQRKHCKVIIYTDSTTAFSGLKAHRLWGPPNVPLRQIMLCTTEYNVLLEPRWLESRANGLADALFWFNKEAITDLCPYLQNPLPSMLHYQPGCNWSEAPTPSKPGLSLRTRRGYQSAIGSFEYYTKYIGVTTWPATTFILEEWAVG